MKIIKRDGTEQEFNIQKIRTAIQKAFHASREKEIDIDKVSDWVYDQISQLETDSIENGINIEVIQDLVEDGLMKFGYFETAKSYIKYRESHKESSLIREKINYILDYASSNKNAASSSNTDANANSSIKNVASIDPEVFKDKVRLIQRQLVKDKLNILYPEIAKQYERDLENHIIYTHDESNSAIPKAYCGAYVLYPLMTEGVGNIDKITPSAPNDIQSFSGQVTNLVFALSAQTKGAVALGDYFVTLNYYVVREFGEDWFNHLDETIRTGCCVDCSKYTIRREIKKGMKQYIYGINQPQGNRGFQSPFTNNQICDKYYFESLFGDYVYPDGTKPSWKAIDTLQRIFIVLLRELRAIKPFTFPVLTISLVYDENGYKDKEYAELCADEWAKGSSHFLYHNSNPNVLSSCCRVSNELAENFFTSTTGMLGLMTGSCNVITLNINRIVQDADREWMKLSKDQQMSRTYYGDHLKPYIENILDRVYKYHIAYKTMLYELESQGMITYSTANYLYIKKLYSTIGVIGYYEAAKYLELPDNSDEYKEFITFIMTTINEYNKKNSIHDTQRPFIFNLEAIPGENLAVKLYNWDKQDGYKVPEDQNLYNCYFFNPWKETNPLNKIKLHSGAISKASNGGQACHINLDEHLSKNQYLKLMDFARVEGCDYFTFNIPMTECEDCGHITNIPVKECPKCGSKHISYWTRIIG